ncbi:tetratricopeptide repeat protein [Flavobacterium cerinum]|uniref:Tetratricopeptide repeat protein n=1 Tax=Flavobacterium cerinum TaxID=2502784 RepID=A0A444HF71_9FLAO|nr:tetratricopeptide repeat protein [Flavobacterium cerinum]RWX03549.1 tetratricopeptide repeat protein [Flavobacterium cerinum]
MYRIIIPFFLFVIPGRAQTGIKTIKEKQQAIVEEYADNCAQKHHYFSSEWQDCLDAGLKIDPTIAYLWQQKAMPRFKQRKYELGMIDLDRAVMYDRERYLDYRAFIKCIFSKNYRDALKDFSDCKKEYGNRYVMDHTYDFYIALCYLQLNEFDEAEKLLTNYINDMQQKNGEDWVHPNALFYLGICKYEKKKYDEALVVFDRALKIYAEFSDVKYYKTIILMEQGKEQEAKSLFKEARANAKSGFTINEDNAVYETYPYQVMWPK